MTTTTQTSSLYERLQNNIDYLEETAEQIEHGDLPGLQPFDDIVTMCASIGSVPVDQSWALREHLAQLVDHMDTLIASIKAYKAALKQTGRGEDLE